MTAIKTLLTDAEILRVAVNGAESRNVIKRLRDGGLWVVETVFTHTLLAAAGTVAVWTPRTTTERMKVRHILLSGGGTAFSGGGGDRLVDLTDGTSIWTAITAAKLGTPTFTPWGTAGVPGPATAADLTTASVAGQNIRLVYSGGAADYTAGSLTLITTLEVAVE